MVEFRKYSFSKLTIAIIYARGSHRRGTRDIRMRSTIYYNICVIYLHLVRRFWNHVLTCASVILSAFASAARSTDDRYLCLLNFSSSCDIWLRVNDVRGFFLLGGVRFWYGWPIRRVPRSPPAQPVNTGRLSVQHYQHNADNVFGTVDCSLYGEDTKNRTERGWMKWRWGHRVF